MSPDWCTPLSFRLKLGKEEEEEQEDLWLMRPSGEKIHKQFLVLYPIAAQEIKPKNVKIT